jgi:hypothetical protein
MTREVKQGDPLSPLLFNVAMDPLLEAISAQNNATNGTKAAYN